MVLAIKYFVICLTIVLCSYVLHVTHDPTVVYACSEVTENDPIDVQRKCYGNKVRNHQRE